MDCLTMGISAIIYTMKKQKHYCPDCGGAQVNHRFLYIAILLSAIVDPWTTWMEKILPEEKLDWVGPGLIKTLCFLRLGYTTKKPNEKDSGRATVLWEEAIRRNINMYEFHIFNIGSDMFISHFDGEMRFFDVLPRPKKYNPKGLSWMDNKSEMKEHFKKVDIKVADGGVTGSLKKGLEIFERLKKPVIAKPNLGSRSRHTTTHIQTKEEFIKAFKLAKQICPWVMIEEELEGYVFRGTLIGKKFIAALRREPAYVIGDGEHNVRELVDIENKNPLRQGPIFHQLHCDEDAEKELKNWGKTFETIPEKNEIVTLGQKTSRSVGGGITDVTDDIHPDNIMLLEKIAETLDDPLIGVDFIMKDASVSWRDQERCGIIECNSAPFIDLHHYPLVGKPRNVAAPLWDIVYPKSHI